jgi:hypothetical protein
MGAGRLNRILSEHSRMGILGLPPGVGVFLIMFNRFHNHVVTQLAA